MCQTQLRPADSQGAEPSRLWRAAPVNWREGRVLRFREWTFRFALAAASLAAALLGLEVVLRVVDPFDGVPGIAVYHPVRDNQLVPGFHGRWHAPVYVNELGFRDYDRPEPLTVEKSAGVTRVIVFGDSTTFGDEYAIEDSFPYLTERILETTDGARRWQVINAGVPGYNTYLAELYIRETLDAYGPDVVVLEYTLNDAAYILPRPADTGFVRTSTRAVVEWLRTNSYAFHFLNFYRSRVANTLDAFASSSPAATVCEWADAHPGGPPCRRDNETRRWYESYYGPRSPGWQLAERSLLAIDALLAERNDSLVLLIYPDTFIPEPLPSDRTPATFGEVYPLADIHRQVAMVLFDRGRARILDGLDVLAPVPRSTIESSVHPGPNANRLIAPVLARCIVDAVASRPTLPERTVRCGP